MDKLKKEAREEFDRNFVEETPYTPKHNFTKENVWQFIDQLIDKAYRNGYTMGIIEAPCSPLEKLKKLVKRKKK